jgi:hypothetical protein
LKIVRWFPCLTARNDSGLAGLGSGGITGQTDVEKRQVVAELQ